MYVTTSRKPTQHTRSLARAFAAFLGATCENRGKKSVNDVAARASKLGHSRFVIISEQHGNPSKMSFAEVGVEWQWLDPEISFTIKGDIPKLRTLGKRVMLEAKGFEHLFDIPTATGKDVVNCVLENNRLTFSYKDNRLVLELK